MRLSLGYQQDYHYNTSLDHVTMLELLECLVLSSFS